jgi:hypothetical protein
MKSSQPVLGTSRALIQRLAALPAPALIQVRYAYTPRMYATQSRADDVPESEGMFATATGLEPWCVVRASGVAPARRRDRPLWRQLSAHFG